MSRSTQFVGLTRAAEDFVKDLPLIPSNRKTSGMFDEDIPLRKWEMHPIFKDDTRPKACIVEVVQTVPWSSGPMIFTCLEIHWGNGAKSTCYQWIDDPMLSRGACQDRENRRWVEEGHEGPCRVTITVGEEYDQEKGTMWV